MKIEFNPLEPRVSRGTTTDLSEATGAGFTSAFEQGSVAEGMRNAEAYGGWRPLFDRMAQGYLDVPAEIASPILQSGFKPDEQQLAGLRSWIEENPQLDIELTPDMEWSEISARSEATYSAARGRIDEADETLSRATPGTALTGQLVGGVGAEMLDPINIATLPVGASVRTGILGTAAIEAALNAGIEGLDTANRNAIARGLGLEETDLIQNMLIGGAFGAVFGGGIKALQRGAPVAIDHVGRMFRKPEDQQALAQAFINSEDPALRAAAEGLTRDLEDQSAAGGGGSAEARVEHSRRAQVATAAMEGGAPSSPALPDRPVATTPRTSMLNGELEEIDPRAIQYDPETFQFKSDADSSGITDKLRDVPEWRSERAGVVLVYESVDGVQFIADGHQRTGLANRIMQSDPAQDIKLAARVFREEDGFSAEQVRVIAALKNISEAADGMTTRMARDAAKVLRVDPEAIRSLPAGPGIGRAQSLSALSDDAFQLVINDVVPDRFGALVGKLVEDPQMQMAMMRLLERTNPATEAQAQSILRQALAAPVTEEVTEDLFGSETITNSLFVERAKVLERAMRLMREDQKTFRTLTERAERIEGAGENQLDAKSNAGMKELMDQALYAVDRLAYRAGPISEALDNGAKNYAQSGKLKDSANAVVDAIRDELGRNGLDGPRARDAGRMEEPANASGETLDPNQGFSDPIEGQDVQRQIAATRMDANERPAEGFSSDEEARRDLGRLVSSGAGRDQLDNHPAVISALEQLEEKAANATNLQEAYGGAEWHATRNYVFKDPDSGLEMIVEGTEAALPEWVREAEAFAGGAVRRERRATIVLGPPAAGKSTIAEELARVKGAAILDSDEIKATLPEFEGGIGAAAVHEESSDLGDLVEAALRQDGTNVVFPKVGGSPGSIRKAIQRFKDDGYTVELVNMAVTPENAYNRMIGRFVSKGRLIPPEYVDAVGDNPGKTYRTIQKEGLADGYAEIDNNGGLDQPQPITDRAGETNPLAESRFDLPESRGQGDVSGEPGAGRNSEETPEGQQLLIDGVKPISARERVQTAADRPLMAPTRTTDSEIGGLFDANDPARNDLFDQVPVGVQDVDGEMRAQVVSRSDLEAELAADEDFAESLGVCLK